MRGECFSVPKMCTQGKSTRQDVHNILKDRLQIAFCGSGGVPG